MKCAGYECNTRHATYKSSMQHATYKRGMQRANATSPCNMQHATYEHSMQRTNATRDTRHTTCNIQTQHAICKRNMQHMNATCNVQTYKHNMQHTNATCNIRTLLNMQHTNMSGRVTSYSSYLRIAACMSNVPCKYAVGRGGMRECAGLRSAERGVQSVLRTLCGMYPASLPLTSTSDQGGAVALHKMYTDGKIGEECAPLIKRYSRKALLSTRHWGRNL